MARTPWDRRTLGEQQRLQNILLRQSMLQMALGHVPYVQRLLAEAGIEARLFKGLEDVPRVPTTLRAHVFDDRRNPDGPAGLIIKPTEEGVKRFGDRGVLWRVARARMMGGPQAQQLAIESATRPIHVHLSAGVEGTVPVAYTRDDLDVLARAGARAAAVAGLDRADLLLNLVPFGPTLDFWGVFYLAHGLGMTALHLPPGAGDPSGAPAAFGGARPTAVAVPADEAGSLARTARAAGIDLSSVRLVLPVGRSLTTEEREELSADLAQESPEAHVSALYGPSEGRVLWAECPVPAGRTETFGFHTYSDIDLVEVLAPDTGRPTALESPGEIAITPLGFRGGGVPRWRTGDLALGGLTTRPCPNCARTLPRVGPSVRRSAWSRSVTLDGSQVTLDLRFLGAAAAERAKDFQVELAPVGAGMDLFVYLTLGGDDARSAVAVYEELSRASLAPTQIVLATPDEIAARHRRAGGPWPRFWERSGRAGE